MVRRQRRISGRRTHHSSGPFRDMQHRPRRREKSAEIPAATAETSDLLGPGHPCQTLDLVGMGVNRIGKKRSSNRSHRVRAAPRRHVEPCRRGRAGDFRPETDHLGDPGQQRPARPLGSDQGRPAQEVTNTPARLTSWSPSAGTGRWVRAGGPGCADMHQARPRQTIARRSCRTVTLNCGWRLLLAREAA
jgi:hypothetical protein